MGLSVDDELKPEIAVTDVSPRSAVASTAAAKKRCTVVHARMLPEPSGWADSCAESEGRLVPLFAATHYSVGRPVRKSADPSINSGNTRAKVGTLPNREDEIHLAIVVNIEVEDGHAGVPAAIQDLIGRGVNDLSFLWRRGKHKEATETNHRRRER